MNISRAVQQKLLHIKTLGQSKPKTDVKKSYTSVKKSYITIQQSTSEKVTIQIGKNSEKVTKSRFRKSEKVTGKHCKI